MHVSIDKICFFLGIRVLLSSITSVDNVIIRWVYELYENICINFSFELEANEIIHLAKNSKKI